MIFGTYKIKVLEQEYIGVAKDCYLCGEAFSIGVYEADTICPKCKKLWKEFVESRPITLSVKVNTDME